MKIVKSILIKFIKYNIYTMLYNALLNIYILNLLIFNTY